MDRIEKAKLLTHEQHIWLLQGLSIEQPKAIKQASKKDVTYLTTKCARNAARKWSA